MSETNQATLDVEATVYVLYHSGDKYKRRLRIVDGTGNLLYRKEPGAPIGSWLLAKS